MVKIKIKEESFLWRNLLIKHLTIYFKFFSVFVETKIFFEIDFILKFSMFLIKINIKNEDVLGFLKSIYLVF